MNRTILITGATLGVLSVVLGAFGAHGLKALIETESLQSFETGVRYQMYHALLLLFVGSLNALTEKSKKSIFYLVVVGVVLFSGSIYGLSTDSLSTFNFKSIAFVTPIGGLFLITAWIVMIIGFTRIKDN